MKKTKLNREKIIKMYKDMMYGFGEYDVYDDDIEPKFKNMSTDEIYDMYNKDKEYYTVREKAGGYWG